MVISSCPKGCHPSSQECHHLTVNMCQNSRYIVPLRSPVQPSFPIVLKTSCLLITEILPVLGTTQGPVLFSDLGICTTFARLHQCTGSSRNFFSLLAVLCFLPSSWYRNYWAPLMQSEPILEGLHLIYYVCRPQEPLTKGKYKRVHGFHGTCIGDCAATVSSEVLRIVAVQIAGRINDIGG